MIIPSKNMEKQQKDLKDDLAINQEVSNLASYAAMKSGWAMAAIIMLAVTAENADYEKISECYQQVGGSVNEDEDYSTSAQQLTENSSTTVE